MLPEPQSRRSARVEELLDHLIALFLAEGFTALSVEDMAVRLRCSKSTLYSLAPSKEQVISTAVRAFFRRATLRVEEALNAEEDPLAQIQAYLDGIAAELAPASTEFYTDLAAFEPTREIYAANTAAAADRVRRLVASVPNRGNELDPRFVGAVAAEAMASIQQGRLRSLAGLDDAASYRALAELITALMDVPSARAE